MITLGSDRYFSFLVIIQEFFYEFYGLLRFLRVPKVPLKFFRASRAFIVFPTIPKGFLGVH